MENNNPRNAGRPKGTPTKSKTFRIHSDLIDFLATKKNQNEYINNLIRTEMAVKKIYDSIAEHY